MSPKLKDDFQIGRLAADLRLRHDGNPVDAIVAFCNRRVRAILKEFRCSALSELLSASAAALDTLFVEILDDADLDRVRREYVAQGEVAFATLREQLSAEVYAITFSLSSLAPWPRVWTTSRRRRILGGGSRAADVRWKAAA